MCDACTIVKTHRHVPAGFSRCTRSVIPGWSLKRLTRRLYSHSLDLIYSATRLSIQYAMYRKTVHIPFPYRDDETLGISVRRLFSEEVVTDFIAELLTLLPSYRLYSLRTFAESSLNSELTFYQIQPRPPFVVHVMMDAKPFIDAYPIVAPELPAVI
jgi:hypothetical protein